MDDGQKQTVNHIYHTLRDMLNKTMTYQDTVAEIKHMLWYLETNFPKDMLKHEMGDRHPLYPPNLSSVEGEDKDECEHPLLTESNWCPECGYITEDEDECNHPALYESCPDEGQGATWYCPDCESVVEINNE